MMNWLHDSHFLDGSNIGHTLSLPNLLTGSTIECILVVSSNSKLLALLK